MADLLTEDGQHVAQVANLVVTRHGGTTRFSFDATLDVVLALFDPEAPKTFLLINGQNTLRIMPDGSNNSTVTGLVIG